MISTRVKIEVRIMRFIDLTVLTLGEIYIWVVHNYPVKKLASRGACGPRSPMAEKEERELRSSADALAVKN